MNIKLMLNTSAIVLGVVCGLWYLSEKEPKPSLEKYWVSCATAEDPTRGYFWNPETKVGFSGNCETLPAFHGALLDAIKKQSR